MVGRRNIRLFFLLGLLSALLLPPAGAVSIDDSFRATGSVHLEGQGSLVWDAKAVALHAGDDDQELQIAVSSADLRVVTVRDVVVTQRDPAGGDRSSREKLGEWQVAERSVEGTMVLTLEASQHGVLRILSTEQALRVPVNASRVSVAPLGTSLAESRDTVFGNVGDVDGHSIRLLGPYTLASPLATLGTLEEIVLLASGGALLLPDGTRMELNGRHLNTELSRRDPATNSSIDVYDSTVLVIESARLDLGGLAAWQLAATGLDGTFDGRAVWHGVTGTVRMQANVAENPEVLELHGRFDLSGEIVSRQGGAWSVRGEADRVAVDLEPVLAVDVEAVVGSLTVMGILVGALVYGRELLAFAVGRLTEPLTSRTRRDILKVVHERQPVGLPELREATGLARSTLRYHLRVMESAQVLQALGHAGRGRNNTYVLNSGSLMFRSDLLDAGTSDGVVVGDALSAASTHPVRRALYRHLVHSGPSNLDRLQSVAAEARGGSIAPSTISYHLRILTQAGLVWCNWQNGRKRYGACIDDAEARRHQYRLFLGRRDWKDAINALLPGPLPEQQVVDTLVRGGHSPRRARDAVRSLCGLAVLEDVGDRIGIHATVAGALRGTQ